MGIVDEDVAAVRDAADIVDIVNQYTQLKRSGSQWSGLCPFHTEKTPSFSVNGELGVYHCFGCQAGGDVISFVREKEGLDFVGAIEFLAARTNITLRYTERAQGEGRKRRDRLLKVMGRAVEWYHERLLTAPDAGQARSYLRQRGLDGDVVREYQIGWAPDSWDELCRTLRIDENDARDTGLGFRNSRNRLQDAFRARVMFPIFDDQGNPVSFGGRILPGADASKGKYKNTPETPLYHKSRVLYGLDKARKAIVSQEIAVICEGYTDVIGFHRSNVPVAVATCGTALTDEHVKLLGRYARRFVLAFDADGAGLAAAERFYQWEREHELEVAVADLPAGLDPGELAQQDPERLAAAVEGATPFLRFRLDRAFVAANFSSPEGRARAAEHALAIVAEHPEPLVRDQYLMEVASRCRVEPDRLRPQLESLRRNGQRPGRSTAAPKVRLNTAPPPRHLNGPATEVLRHAMHNREAVETWLLDELFAHPLLQEALATLREASTPAQAIASASPDVADLLARLAVEEPSSEPFDAVRRLVTEVARHEVDELRLRAASVDDPSVALADSAFLGHCIQELRDPDTSVGAAERLVAFLATRVGDGG